MPKFSIKALFLLMGMSGIACSTLAHPSMITTAVVMLVAALCLSSLLIWGLRKRNYLSIAFACFCGCYLVVADGGIFPGLERWMPTERLLEQCTKDHTVLGNGHLRPRSLAKWFWNVYAEKNHRDRSLFNPPEKITNTNIPQPANVIAVELPKLSFTTISTLATVFDRGDPQKQNFFYHWALLVCNPYYHCFCIL